VAPTAIAGARRADLAVRPEARAAIRGLHLVTAVLVVVYLGSTILRRHPPTISLYDGWVGNRACAGRRST
jgi:hypothetical protein